MPPSTPVSLITLFVRLAKGAVIATSRANSRRISCQLLSLVLTYALLLQLVPRVAVAAPGFNSAPVASQTSESANASRSASLLTKVSGTIGGLFFRCMGLAL